MNEDTELMEFVKARLEEGLPLEVPRMNEIMHAAREASFAREASRRSRRRLWGSTLAAASIALVCSFAAFFAQTGSPAPENTIADVIDLLRTADGEEVAASGEADSVADMLLAWQDAPYEAAIAGLVAAAE